MGYESTKEDSKRLKEKVDQCKKLREDLNTTKEQVIVEKELHDKLEKEGDIHNDKLRVMKSELHEKTVKHNELQQKFEYEQRELKETNKKCVELEEQLDSSNK